MPRKTHITREAKRLANRYIARIEQTYGHDEGLAENELFTLWR